MLADIIGSGTQSRLYKGLVVEQKLAAYVGAWYTGDQLDYGTFGVYGAPNPGVDVNKVEAAIDIILADILKNGVTQKELDRVRNQAIAERVYTLDDQATLARMAGVAFTTGLSARSIFDRDIEIGKVTLDDIRQAAAAKIIVLKRSVTGILLPETQIQN